MLGVLKEGLPLSHEEALQKLAVVYGHFFVASSQLFGVKLCFTKTSCPAWPTTYCPGLFDMLSTDRRKLAQLRQVSRTIC